MGNYSFYFTTFELQDNNPYTITFIGNCTRIDNKVKIHYMGADINTTSAIPEDWLNDLKKRLNVDYGYGPYDECTVEQIFKDHKHYLF